MLELKNDEKGSIRRAKERASKTGSDRKCGRIGKRRRDTKDRYAVSAEVHEHDAISDERGV